MATTPLLRSAYVLTSETAAANCATRRALRDALIGVVAQVTATGRVDRVEGFEPDAVQQLLSTPDMKPPIVDLQPERLEDTVMRPLLRGLHLRELSNALKHLTAIRAVSRLADGAAAAPTQRFSLVVEDDAAFGEGMVEALARAARDAPEDADLVFLGLPSTGPPPPAGLAARAKFADALVLFDNQVLPACESYLITPAGAARLASQFLPARFCTTIHLTYLLRKGVARAYVASPNAFVDASKLGLTVSTVASNNQLLWNPVYCRADTLVRGDQGQGASADYVARYEELWAQQQYKEHPDVLALHALHLERCGRVADALEVYERVLGLLDRGGCVVNHSSEFLKRYMALHGKL
jgi:hypothetical protein